MTLWGMANPAILVMAYNRPALLESALSALTALPEARHFAIYVSVDGGGTAVMEAAGRFNVTVVAHERVARLDPKQRGPAWLAQHYGDALDRVFNERRHSHAVILEDDMVPSPDLLAFMGAAAPVLAADPTVWCASSWNDNGYKGLATDEGAVFRTSFFPGLGWMMAAELWAELGPSWPLQHWDHYMRIDAVSKGRECIVPEVSRNRNVGVKGATMSQAEYDKLIGNIAWAEHPAVDWSRRDLVAELSLTGYDERLSELLGAATVVKVGDVRTRFAASASAEEKAGTYVVPYRLEEFERLAKVLGLMPHPRADHHGLHRVKFHGFQHLYLVDVRRSPFAIPPHRIEPDTSLTIAKGSQGESCSQVCPRVAGAGFACDVTQFDFIMSGIALADAFPCEAGFGNEWGTEIPCYVSSPEDLNFQRCLVTEAQPTCEAKHPHTSRLCPCTRR